MDVKSLKENYKNYYKNKLKIKDTYDLYNYSINKNLKNTNEIKLCENHDELGDADLSIINLLNTLRNNYKNLVTLIENLNQEDKEQIADLIGHFFYENICVNNPEHDELLHICYLLMEKEINSLEDPNPNGFLENSFIGKLLKNLTKRTDVKNYLSLTVKDIILKMENLSENFMEIDLDKISEYLKTSKNDETMYSNSFLEKAKTMIEKIKKDEKKKQINARTSKEFLANLSREPFADRFNNFEPMSLPQNNKTLLNMRSSFMTSASDEDRNNGRDISKKIIINHL